MPESEAKAATERDEATHLSDRRGSEDAKEDQHWRGQVENISHIRTVEAETQLQARKGSLVAANVPVVDDLGKC